jgi:cellulose synthase/poly-beta-1,6-N-acetylglucosamine synthase-like glycosyltransferase
VAVAASHPPVANQIEQGRFLGTTFRYASDAPPALLALLSILVTLALASAVSVTEWRVATSMRRSVAAAAPLAPRRVMAATRGRYDGPVTVTVLVPAHNEEAHLPRALGALFGQTHVPDRVLVVADNCTDRTQEVARAAGAEVVATRGNTEKKAGALNQVLADLLPRLGPNDAVMVMDADTELEPDFLATAVRRFTDDRALMAVGGLFYGEPGHGLIGQFQRNEYTRYSRDLERRRGKVYVLTGTASVFRSTALSTVSALRGTVIPGQHGKVYDTAALTEDNELTIALKSLGALTVSPRSCRVVTELMPTWRALWHQRLRWQRGALENLSDYGFRPTTLRYWAQQLGIGYGVVALACYIAMTFVMVLAEDQWVWFPFWLAVGLFFAIERVATVWKGGWPARLVAALVFPELVYAAFLNLVFVQGILDMASGRRAIWSHHNDSTAKAAP